jgi:hypothetical protein
MLPSRKRCEGIGHISLIMDIDSFISGIIDDPNECALASAGFTAYYRSLFKLLGPLTSEEFAICSILNFSAQQLSNRTARGPRAHCIAHFTASPLPFFSAAILKLIGYTEVHLLPTAPYSAHTVEQIQQHLSHNNNTEVKGPYLHKTPDLSDVKGSFGLVHLIDCVALPDLDLLCARLSKFTDIIAVGASLSPIGNALSKFNYQPLITRLFETRHVGVFRRDKIPGPREVLR